MSLFGGLKAWRARRAAKNRTRRAEAFWRWFSDIADELLSVVQRDVPQELEGWITKLNRQAKAYHPLVGIVVGGPIGEPGLVVTCDGAAAGAEHVRALVQLMPALPGWSARAFKPQLDMSGCAVKVGSVTLTPSDVEWAVVTLRNPEYGAVTLLILFVRGMAGPQGTQVEFAADQLFQSVLGEERALRWADYMDVYDSENGIPDKLQGIPRTPLSAISGVLEKIDQELGPGQP
jgi:hypothetical protein